MNISLYDPESGNSSGMIGAPISMRSSMSGYSGSVASRIGVCQSCSHAVWKDEVSGISNASGISGVPGVNMFCVFVSKIASFLCGIFVVPEAGVLDVPFIPAD